MLRKNGFSVAAFTKDLVDPVESRKMSLRESFLVGDEQVVLCGSKPTWEHPLEKDIGIISHPAWKKTTPGGNFPTMRDGDIEAARRQGFVDEVDIPVESHTVGACYDVDVGLAHRSLVECGAMVVKAVFAGVYSACFIYAP